MVEINIFRRAPNAISLAAGAVLFSEGDVGELMYAVIEGQVDLTRHGQLIEAVGPGGILGELALVDPAPRSADAVAHVDSKVVPVDKKAFTYLVQEHPTFALTVMGVLAERIRRANESRGHD